MCSRSPLTKGTVCFWNCGGGLKSKYYFVKDFLYDLKPSILFVSESEVTDKDLGILTISGYDLITTPSVSKGGKSRIACYIKNGIKYKQLKVDADLDIIALDVGDSRIVGLYRGFKLIEGETRSSFFNTIIKNLYELSRTDLHLLIGGDFNVDLFKKTANLNDLQNWAIDCGLIQLTDKYTWRRVISNVIHESALDHIYTSENNLVSNHITSVSDHDILAVSKIITHDHRQKLELRDWRGYSQEKAHKLLNEEMVKMGTEIGVAELTKIMNMILNELAPKRILRVKPTEIVSQKLEKLKKKRDRKYRAFKKTKDPEYLKSVNDLNKDIRLVLKQESCRIFQGKAKSKDPKTFWQAVNQSLGKTQSSIFDIENELGTCFSDPKDTANCFAEFFKNKVEKLSQDPVSFINLVAPTRPLKFSLQELEKVMKGITGKKCFGPDGVPQNLLKDTFGCIPVTLLDICNGFAKNGLPKNMKEARVLPLHKKGSKSEVINYRPISNVCSLSKIYERCILQRLEQEAPNCEGQHQHGFRQKHSTETALLTLQSYIAGVLESKKPGIVYSVDLSAAFDLLKPDKFFDLFKNDLSEGLMFSIMDFLQERKFHVEVNGVASDTLELDRGCVQGSVLGPRLFSMYVGKLESALMEANKNIKLVSYADDSYVIISEESEAKVVTETEKIITKHISFLRSLGMVVNESKTEFMWLGKNIKERPKLKISGMAYEPVLHMKALGIYFDGLLTWDKQAERAITQGHKLISVFKFLRKQMTESQFLKSVTANYYSSVFYCSSVWYNSLKAVYNTKLTSLHFRLLRTACKDYNKLLSRDELTERCKRATPNEWSRYTTSSIAMKVFRDKCPERLHEILQKTFYTERRNRGKGLFFDGSKSKVGKQSIQNRLQHIKSITESWCQLGTNITNDKLRVILKKTFFKYTAIMGTTEDNAPQRVAPVVTNNEP